MATVGTEAYVCPQCNDGNHERCIGDDGDGAGQPRLVCTCDVCRKRREKAEKDFEDAALLAFCGHVDYATRVEACAKELAELPLEKWNRQALFSLMNRHLNTHGMFWEVTTIVVINRAAALRGVKFRIQVPEDFLKENPFGHISPLTPIG